ncbi:hypothetical protein MICRO8M_30120 [Microbacterium sp. 8M]|nr:hypothetical protein MICRO8M_30120 [Microbacterium sp. 8M]
MVDHPHRPDRHVRPDRIRRHQLRLGQAHLARLVHRRHLPRPGPGAVRGLPDPREDPRPLHQAVLLRCVARRAARVREPQLDRHAAPHRARHRAQPRCAPRLRLVRGAARRHHQDGRLRRDLPGARRDLRRAVLPHRPEHHAVRADHHRLGGRIRRDRRHHRCDRDADPHPVDPGPAARGRRPAARHRPDPRHGPHRGQRRGPGPGADDRRQARGDPRSRPLQRAPQRSAVRRGHRGRGTRGRGVGRRRGCGRVRGALTLLSYTRPSDLSGSGGLVLYMAAGDARPFDRLRGRAWPLVRSLRQAQGPRRGGSAWP